MNANSSAVLSRMSGGRESEAATFKEAAMRRIMQKQRNNLWLILALFSSVIVWAQPPVAQNPYPPGIRQKPAQQGQMSGVTFAFGTIDFPNAPDSDAQAVNDKNEIVGASGGDLPDFRLGLPAYGFVQKGNSFKKIAYPSAPITVPFGVNSLGEIVGFYSLDPADYSGHGFTLVGTTYTTVDYPGAKYTSLSSINKSGQMLAQGCFSGEFFCRSFLLNSGVFTQLMFPGAAGTLAYGINDSGEIVGYYSNDKVTYHGFTLISGIYTSVDYPGATDSYLYGLNNNGQIVGAYDYTMGSTTHGFLLDSGTFTSFDVPYAGVLWTYPFGINDKGRIVGQYWDSNNYTFGFSAQIH
jgi:hypothetical protein